MKATLCAALFYRGFPLCPALLRALIHTLLIATFCTLVLPRHVRHEVQWRFIEGRE